MGSRFSLLNAQSWNVWSRLASAALGLVILVEATTAVGAEQTPRQVDALLRLVDPDAAVVVTVEGLRDQANAFFKSRLATDLEQLPAVREWFASEQFRQFESSRVQIETLLGAKLTDLRDELVGDAVVMALHLPPVAAADGSQARGLLLVRARDPALLNRVIGIVNSAQQDSGELSRVVERQRTGTTYFVREFPAEARRADEFYIAFGDGVFAASNSERLLESVIDRRIRHETGTESPRVLPKGDAGLGDQPRFKTVQTQLPEPALARVFVEPRQFERLLAASSPPSKAADVQIMAMLIRYLASVDYAGLALTRNERSIAIHSVETLNPSHLDAWLRHWASDTRPTDLEIARVPPTALALASGQFDGIALLDAVTQLVPALDQPKFANMQTALGGLLLGQDLRTQVLPRLGPSVLAYFDIPGDVEEQENATAKTPPAGGWPFPLVVVVSLAGDDGPANAPLLAAALDNALRTVLAITALDDKRASGRSRITTRAIGGTAVTTLDPPINFAYAIDQVRRRLILSTSSDAVVHYLESSGAAQSGERFHALRSATFPEALTYACVDLDAVNQLAAKHRTRLLQFLSARQNRPAALIDHDLAQVLALTRLFRAGFITSRLRADATAVHRSAGLILRDQDTK
jgi:hypothetical protein